MQLSLPIQQIISSKCLNNYNDTRKRFFKILFQYFIETETQTDKYPIL